MKVRPASLLCMVWLSLLTVARGAIVFDATSAYHHIRVVDDRGMRVLSFDGTQETRMSLANPLQGHFSYTEYFHMPWLWNQHPTNVLMVGLGGGSTQRAYQHYAPGVTVETAEIDPIVVRVAREYFGFQESASNKVTVSDGRVFLRRSTKKYDAILMDAYVKSRYGSFIPHHLATREFFQLADEHMADQGVLAYNVIGTFTGWQADIVGAVYRTMNSVFPQVYLFPAPDSLNVVLVATKTPEKVSVALAQKRAADLVKSGRVQLPTFLTRAQALRTEPPASFARSPILTDDFAPVDGLLRGRTSK